METTTTTSFSAAKSNVAFAHSAINSFSPAASQLDVPLYPTPSDDLPEMGAPFDGVAYSSQINARFPDRMTQRHPGRSISDHRGR